MVATKNESQQLASWNLTDVDFMLLKQTDEEYEPHSWEGLKWIVGKFLHQAITYFCTSRYILCKFNIPLTPPCQEYMLYPDSPYMPVSSWEA